MYFNQIVEEYEGRILSYVITVEYLSARDLYRVEGEENTGKSYGNFTFHGKIKNNT